MYTEHQQLADTRIHVQEELIHLGNECLSESGYVSLLNLSVISTT